MAAPVRPTQRRQYTQDDVQKAVDMCKAGSSASAAAKNFGIPKSTLFDRLSNRNKIDVPLGRQTILTSDEENILVEWVDSIAKSGFPIGKEQVISSVKNLVKDTNRPNPFSGSVPGDHWFSLFLKRHPETANKIGQSFATARDNVTEQLNRWFEGVSEYVTEKGLSTVFENPGRIFNADEIAFFLHPLGNRVLARRGLKKSVSDKNECLSVTITVNAAGVLAPPMVLFPYEQRIPAGVVKNFPESWCKGKSEKGWMSCETFFEYVTNVFYPWVLKSKIQLPVVLFIDSHKSLVTKHLSDFCARSCIEIIPLYPNTTHLPQPMEGVVFDTLKATWKKAVQQWDFENRGCKMNHEKFAPLLKTVLDSSLKKETIVNSFKATGLLSFDVADDSFSRLLKKKSTTSTATNLAAKEQREKEIQSHLNYMETKIGLQKVRQFHKNKISPSDKSLFEVWQGIRKDLSLLLVNSSAVEQEVQELEADIQEFEEQELEEHEFKQDEEESMFLDVDNTFPLPEATGRLLIAEKIKRMKNKQLMNDYSDEDDQIPTVLPDEVDLKPIIYP